MLPCLRDGGCSSRKKETFGETQFVIVRHLGNDFRRFMFDVLCSTFYVGRFVFDVLCSTFYVGRFIFEVLFSTFYVWRFIFDVLCWTFYVRPFMFDVLCSLFNFRRFMFYFGSWLKPGTEKGKKIKNLDLISSNSNSIIGQFQQISNKYLFWKLNLRHCLG